MTTYRVPHCGEFQWQAPVEDKDLTTPPATTKGNRYIVASGATGAWSGKAGQIAVGTGSGWEFTVPTEGMITWVKDEDCFYKYIAAWAKQIDATAFHTDVSAEISGLTEKTTPVAADLLVIEDSAASNAKKKLQLGNVPFLVLSDTPDSYTSQGSKLVRVNSGATALEFTYRLTVANSAPSSPSTNDIWIDIS